MRRGLLVNVGLAAGVSIVFVGALEGLARWVAPAPPAPRAVADYIWDWDHMMPGGFYVMRSRAVGWPPWEEFNADGIRDRTRSHEKPEGSWRIAVLGDSVTLGAGIPPPEAYPRVMDATLRRDGRRIEVMSVALWGWSTRQERIAWHRIARAYRPDQAILAVCLNDIPELHNNLARPPRWVAWLHERSALVRFVVRAEDREIEDVERLFASPDSPPVREALERFFEEVRALRREVEEDGARFAVIVFPFRFQLEAGAPPPVVQERTLALGRAEGMTCLDLLPALGTMGEAAFLDYDHLSVAGSRLAADTLLASEILPAGFSNPAVLREHFGSRRDRAAREVLEWLEEPARRPEPAGLAALTEALAAEDTEVRMAAAWALEAAGPPSATAGTALARALREDRSTGVRVAAARALGAVGPPDAGLGGTGGRGETSETGSDEDEGGGDDVVGRGDAMRATGGGDEADEEQPVRAGPGRSLDGRVEAGDSLAGTKGERDVVSRHDSTRATGRADAGERPVKADPGGSLDGRDDAGDTRSSADRVDDEGEEGKEGKEVAGRGPAIQVSDERERVLFDALFDPSEAVRHAAAGALHSAGVGDDDLARLVRALDSDDAYVRGFAAWSLGNLGTRAGSAVPALVAALDRPDTEATVISALARVGPAAYGAIPALVAALRGDDADQRWRAARTLGRIGPGARAATPDLITALGDPDDGVRRHAARALGRVATADGPAPFALQRATGDKSAEVRNEARRALERLSGRPPARTRAGR